MVATSSLDLRLLRALRDGPTHGYALARQLADEADRATVYRRLAALRRASLVASTSQRGAGPERKAYALTPSGELRLREELREATRVLMEAFAARARPRGGAGGAPPRPPIVFVSGSRFSGIERRIVASLARGSPGRVHLVMRASMGDESARETRALPVPLVEGSWSEIPFRDGYARTLFVNELPPRASLPAAVREWARVLAKGGALHVIAPAPLPRGADPFIDFLAELRDELHPDSADAPEGANVTRALAKHFDDVDETREADQRVWSAIRNGRPT